MAMDSFFFFFPTQTPAATLSQTRYGYWLQAGALLLREWEGNHKKAKYKKCWPLGMKELKRKIEVENLPIKRKF